MKITMTETRIGTSDGFKIQSFMNGQTYETEFPTAETPYISETLAGYYLKRGFAHAVREPTETMEEFVARLGRVE